jgi:hypothetical protein
MRTYSALGGEPREQNGPKQSEAEKAQAMKECRDARDAAIQRIATLRAARLAQDAMASPTKIKGKPVPQKRRADPNEPERLRAPARPDQATRRLSAEDFPVRQSAMTSKETFCPSLRELKPARSTALI